MTEKIVITGISGLIGRVLYDNLRERWDIQGIARKDNGLYPITPLDIQNTAGLKDVCKNACALIHLAANASPRATWEETLRSNIQGTENVFQAAKEAGVPKVIFASSNHVVGLYENDHPYRKIVTGNYDGLDPSAIPLIDHASPVRPDSYYGASKAFGEALGRYYSERFGMQMICIRIGTVNHENRPLNVRQFATLFMYEDLVKMTEICLADQTLNFEIFYGVSNNTWKFWDTDHITDLLGWSPECNAEIFR